MRKVILVCSLFVIFFACKKDNPTAHVYTYNEAIDSLHLSYDHGYTIHLKRNGVDDTDFVIFHPNGTVSEVANVYDLGSHVFPDTLTYTVSTSFDYNINWNQIPNALVMSFYPIRDTVKGYLMHDYLNTEIMYLYQSKTYTQNHLIKFVPTVTNTGTAADSTAVVSGSLY